MIMVFVCDNHISCIVLCSLILCFVNNKKTICNLVLILLIERPTSYDEFIRVDCCLSQVCVNWTNKSNCSFLHVVKCYRTTFACTEVRHSDILIFKPIHCFNLIYQCDELNNTRHLETILNYRVARSIKKNAFTYLLNLDVYCMSGFCMT